MIMLMKTLTLMKIFNQLISARWPRESESYRLRRDSPDGCQPGQEDQDRSGRWDTALIPRRDRCRRVATALHCALYSRRESKRRSRARKVEISSLRTSSSHSSICSGVFPMLDRIIGARMTNAQVQTRYRFERRAANRLDDSTECNGAGG